jgi:Tfp pilus assembly protein PilN
MKAVNLLTPELRRASSPEQASRGAASAEPGARGAIAVLGALALCVGAVAGYVVTGNQVKQDQADLADAQARNAAVVAQSTALKPYADFQSVAQARVATVRDLATQRFDWERSFRGLARALPEDVTVKSLAASVGAAGGGGSALRGAIQAPAITLEACTVDQDAVARACVIAASWVATWAEICFASSRLGERTKNQ